jgi:hypothetical protein
VPPSAVRRRIISLFPKKLLDYALATQSLSQVGSARLVGALENRRLLVVPGLRRDPAEIQAKQIDKADPMAIKEERLIDTQHVQ